MEEIFKLVAGKYIRNVKTGKTWHASSLVTEVNYTKAALHEVLDSLGALGNWTELTNWGFSEERAKEIIGYCQ
jgi:hypothetical protein